MQTELKGGSKICTRSITLHNLVPTDAATIICPVHGSSCGDPQLVLNSISSCAEKSSWGVNTANVEIYQCRKVGLRFRLTPGHSQVLEFYGAPYQRSMDGTRNRSRALGANKENLHRISILKRFLKNGQVLDFGCSTGLFAAQLRDAGYTVEGSDISTFACDQVQMAYPDIPVHCGALESYCESLADRFDAVTMMDVIEHLEDVPASLRRIRSMIKENGYLLLRTPSLRSPFFLAANLSYHLSLQKYKSALFRAYHAEHLIFFDEKSLARTLEEQGFAVKLVCPDPLLWENFKSAEMTRGGLDSLILGAIYFAGRIFGRGHGMLLIAQKPSAVANPHAGLA